MQELEKILEELKRIKDGNRKEKLYAKYPPNSKDQEVLNAYSQGYEDGTDNLYNAADEIIRKHMKGANGTFAFDFSNTDSFDCPCGRHYVHMKMPPKLVFCPECEEKVRNNRTDICPECRKKLYEYEKKYNCIVDIGIIGAPGEPGGSPDQDEA